MRSVAKLRLTPYLTSAQLTNRPSCHGASLTIEKIHVRPPSWATPVVVDRSPTRPGRKPVPDGAWLVRVRTNVRTANADSVCVPIRCGSQAWTRVSRSTWRVPPRWVGMLVTSACLVVQALRIDPMRTQTTARGAASTRRDAGVVTLLSSLRGRLGLGGRAGPGRRARPVGLVQHDLAQPHRVRCDLDALVLAAELQ